MTVFLQLCCLFAVGAVAGWVLELFFRRIFSAKKWINPGFLNGPYLPLYGCGTLILYGVCDLELTVWAKILLCGVLTTAAEYLSGLFFLKVMKLRLWDYRGQWGNLQGLICPLFSLLWTALGTLFLFFVFPWLQNVLAWFAARPLSPFFLGMFYGVFLVDVGISLGLGARLRKLAAEAKEVLALEELKGYLYQQAKRLRKRVNFLLPLRSERSLRENIRAFLDSRRRTGADPDPGAGRSEDAGTHPLPEPDPSHPAGDRSEEERPS